MAVDAVDGEGLSRVVGRAGPADPRAARLSEHGQERPNQAAGAWGPAGLRRVVAHHGQPVGGNHDRPVRCSCGRGGRRIVGCGFHANGLPDSLSACVKCLTMSDLTRKQALLRRKLERSADQQNSR